MLHLDMDPYLTAPDVWIGSPESWPDVSFPDICTYLLFSPSPCTKDDLKAYKSTEAWTYAWTNCSRAYDDAVDSIDCLHIFNGELHLNTSHGYY